MPLHPRAGQPADPDTLVNLPRLVSAYFTETPDPADPAQKVAFGTSGHRGVSFQRSFNEAHVLAITQAIVEYRAAQGITGPLYLGIDTHALSIPAGGSALEVLAANGVTVMIDDHDGYTPTPVISHAIPTYNRGRSSGLADGVVVSPSHNPPEGGGFKYNPPNGGPAGTEVTAKIEARANELLATKLAGVRRLPLAQALRAGTTLRHDYIGRYVGDPPSVIDLELIRGAGLKLGVDPLGGSGVAYWPRIAEQYRLDLTVVTRTVAQTFRFMTLAWDGPVPMDPSSPHAMRSLIALADRFDVAFACDPDHDRHGIVTRSGGLMQPNHYLAVAIDQLFRNRPQWPAQAAVGKTLVSSAMIDRVAERLGRRLHEVPVGFKWFVDGLIDGSLGFGGEESAGASFLRRDGSVWSTDKDGLVPALLSAEITARNGRDPAELYRELTQAFGEPAYDRVDAPASREQKQRLGKLSPDQLKSTDLAGEPITAVLTKAPGNGAAIGGLKVQTASSWFAARPSGTEDIYKIYAESFKGAEHLKRVFGEAQAIVDGVLKG